jgi:hypothetical protein
MDRTALKGRKELNMATKTPMVGERVARVWAGDASVIADRAAAGVGA